MIASLADLVKALEKLTCRLSNPLLPCYNFQKLKETHSYEEMQV